MSARARFAALLAAPALLLGAGSAGAQVCATGPGVALAGGYTTHAVAGGTDAPAIGVDVAFPAGPLAARVDYRRMIFEGDAPATDAVRASLRYPVLVLAGVQLCGDVHAGATRFSAGEEDATVLAGGLGLTLAPTGGAVQPYASVRGLGARTSGQVLGQDVSASGQSLGVEVGVQVGAGPFSLRLSAARDGFDDALGVTPYPETAFELALGLRF